MLPDLKLELCVVENLFLSNAYAQVFDDDLEGISGCNVDNQYWHTLPLSMPTPRCSRCENDFAALLR